MAALELKLRTKNEVLSELMEEHVALKKVLGRPEGPMGTARYARPGDRLRPSLERPHRDRAPEVHSWAGSGPQQVLRLEVALWESQRTQQLDSARLLAGGLGEARHPGLSRALSAGRLSPADVHDAGCRCRGGESDQCLARAALGRAAVALESPAIGQGEGLRAAARPAPALARGCRLHQYCGHFLLPVQRARRLQSLCSALGDSRVDDRSRSRADLAAGVGAVSSGLATDHLRQRAAIHRSRLQRIHPHVRHDPRPNVPVLPTVERKNREMAPIAKIRMCSSWSAAVDRRRASARRALRELLQPSSSSQRDWICDTTGQAGGARGTNLCRARSQTGRRAAAATDPPSGRAGKTEYRWRLVGPAAKLIAPGETEAGSAGKQPCRGITRWAHRDDEVGACEHCSAPPYHSSADLIRAIDPDALKILARRAKHPCLTKNGDSPFPAEPEHSHVHLLQEDQRFARMAQRIVPGSPKSKHRQKPKPV